MLGKSNTSQRVSPNHRCRKNRTLRAESLESRSLMAADVAHNFLMPHDVNDDGNVSPIDVLVVINRLNGNDDLPGGEREFHDVDDDSRLTPLDVLNVINDLNSQNTPRGGEVHQASNVTGINQVRARVELEKEGLETELKIRIDDAPASQSFAVTLNDIALGQLMTDRRGRGELVLSRGDDNRNHQPLPDSLTTLSPEMELIIGDIVRGKVANVAKIESEADVPNQERSSNVNNSVSRSSNLNLTARFDVVAGQVRSAEYERETERGVMKQSFKAEIENASPNATYEVFVDGRSVGKLMTNSKGKGSLRLTTRPNDARDGLLPPDFPNVVAGTTVMIGAVSASFR